MSSLAKSFDDTGSKSKSAAAGVGDAWGSALGALNATGVLGPLGGALDGINTAIGKVIEHGKDIGPAMIGAGAAVAGIGTGLEALGSKDQAAHQQLQQSITATGKDYDDFGDQIEQAIKHQENFGNSASETQDALRILTQATGDPAKALDTLNTATDLAKAKHESLDTAATQLGKAYNGSGRILREFHVATTDASGAVRDHTATMTDLAGVLSGQAAAASDTFSGKLDAIKTKVEDHVAMFGERYGPAIQTAGIAMVAFGAVMETIPAILGAVSAAQTIMAATEWLSLWPILAIIAGIALLVVGIYELVTHWDTVWNAIKAGADAVWHFLQDVWDKILGAINAVWQWVKDNWPLLLAILTGPFGLAVDAIVHNWDTIKDAVSGVVDWIRQKWDDVVGFLQGLPGRVAGIFDGMWDGITDAFRSAVNALIDVWNGLHFTLPSIDALGVHLGGETIGVPHIPHLAQGGLITGDGIVYAHAGEVISPAPAGAGGITIENVNLSDGADVDLLLHRLAFAQTAGRL
jgi:hypothetical protein